MVVGKTITIIIELLIAGALLTTSGLSAYYAAGNYTGISSVIMPFVPLMVGLLVLFHAMKQAGFNPFGK
jgi:hypothetical protein